MRETLETRSGSRWYDFLGAYAAIAWFALSIFESARALAAAKDDTAGLLLKTFYCSNILLLLLMIAFLAVRREAVLRPGGPWPGLAGAVGLVAPLLIALVPVAPPTPARAFTSAALMLLGALGGIWAMLYLRRAFSILPQARLLVTAGPFRYVRHPLYLSEFVAVAGVMLNHAQPWATLVYLIAMLAQLPRIFYEEAILQEAFPEYREYAMKTAKFVPFIY